MFQEQIAQKHNEGVALDQQFRDTLLGKLETTRDVGVLLGAVASFEPHRRAKRFKPMPELPA